MKNLTFKAAMLNDSQPTVNRRSTDGQSQRHCKQTPLSKRWKVLMTLVFLFTLAIGNVWGAASNPYCIPASFEASSTTAYTWSKNSGEAADRTDKYARTGGYSAYHFNKKNGDKEVRLTTGTIPSYNSANYVHAIVWARKGVTSATSGNKSKIKQLYLSGGGASNSSSSQPILADNNWHCIFASGNRSNSNMTSIRVDITTTAQSSTDTIFYDDIIVYYDANQKIDLKKPGSATITAHTTSALTWTSGTDASDDNNGATDVQKTLIFKKTTGTADGLSLNDQGVYSLTATEGPSTVGDWTLVAVVDPTTESYTTDLTPDHHYAIVHRDLAYNYSNPVYTTITVSCNTPTTTFANGSYTVDETPLALSSLISEIEGDGAISYEVKDANGTGASITAGAFTATTAGSATVTATQAADATNGFCEKIMDATITVSPAGAVESNIIYTETKGATNTNPAKYTEGTGIASFEALADVTDFHFTGWSPVLISTEATGPQTIEAQWVAAYNVTFSAGAGSGTAPDGFQKWEGAKFNLPGQGEMVAPEGKAFDGWKANGTGDKLAANAEYTMGDDDVEFVAQWKAVPQTIYSLTVTNSSEVNLANGGTQNDLADDATIVGGGAYMQNDHASKTQQILASTKLQFKAGTVTLVMTLNTALQEGDTIKATGLNQDGLRFGITFDRAANVDNQLAPDASEFIVPAAFEGASTLYAWRHADSGTTCASIKVIRPAARPSSTVISLSDLKVNNRSISSDSLTTLVSAKSLLLKDEYAVAPVIKFNEHKVITYSDELLPATKVTDKVHTVTATLVDGNWQAQATINAITYTVTAPKQSSAKVTYYDGETKIGEETVGIGGNPAEYADYQDKDFATFVGWYSNADLADEHAIDIAALTVGADKAVYGKWTPAYASSINIEQWVLDNGAGKGNNKVAEQTAAFITAMTGLNYKCADLNELDSLRADKNNDDRNEPYLGIKWKKASSQISFLLKSGSKVRVKLGNIGSGVDLIIDEDAAIAKDASFEYENTTGADVIVTFKGKGTSTLVLKQIMIDDVIATVKLPAVVTYDANGGTFGKTTEKYTGTPLVIADATPADAAYEFEGWHVGTVEGAKINAAAYEPAKDITLVAKYVVKPSPFSLTALTYTIGAGEAQNVGYVEGTYTYTVELPYAGSYENITVAATLKEAGSSIVEGAVMTVTSLPGAATFTVSDGAEGTQLYTINFKKGAKDGVEIIGVVTTGGTNKTVSGLYKGDASVDLDGDKKIASGKSIYVTLASGYTFEETDVLVVDVAAKSDLPNDPALEITTGVGNISGSVWKSIANADYELHLVTIPLTGIAANQTSIGLKRSDHQNTWVNGLKVYRPMMPKLTAITINGEACVKGEGNTFSITLPEEGTNLASLEVVPTIIRNAAHATTPEAVISNEGAWKAGDNTYRVMDKDGDYTDYTITITLQGQAPAPFIATQPAGVTYCAGSEPTLTVEATGDELHYAWFKEAGETDEAVGTDAASYTVEAAGTYYVIVTNHVDGKLDASVTSENAVVTLNVAAAITKQPTNKRDIALNSEVTLSVEATNATGYQWYSCEDAEKHGAAAISGAEAANYVFNCSANAFYYCVVGNACGDDITSDVVSVKLEPEGCNTFASKPAASPYNYTQAGEWTFYFVDSNGADKSTDNVFEDGKNFDDEDVVVANTRRFALKFEKDVESVTLYGVGGNDKSFEKVSVSDEMKKSTYTELTATATKTDLTSQQHIFTIEDMIIPAGKYAWFELSGSLKFFKICYTAALVEPKLPTLVNQELCAGADYETFNATITNAAACEGTVSYKWYETTDTENPVAETAEFTPGADGTYYVVVKHAAAGHATRVAQSANLTVAHFAAPALESYSEDVFQHMGTEATLSVTATGSGLAYAWYTCDAEGNNAVAVDPAVNAASMHIASVAEGVRYYKVAISNTCDATTLSHIFKVEGWNQLEQVDVTATTTWDMTNVSASAINLKNEDLALNKQNVRLLLANIDGVNNNASFNSQALYFEGQHIGRTSNNVKHLAGQYVQFNVTVPGMVSVTFASNGGARTIQINGKECSRTTDDGNYIRYDVAVEPGSVEIKDVQGYVRISKIEFKAEDNYHRTVNPAYLGTLCWTNNAILGGAKLYEFQGRDAHNYLVFDEVLENRLEAGKPYIFMPENGNTEIKVYNTDNNAVGAPVDPETGIYGTLVNKDLYPSTDVDLYYFSANHIWAVKDFTVDKITIPANFCYVNYTEVLEGDLAPVNPAPGRRRVTMGVNGQNVATGMGEIEASETPMKVMIDGQLFIIRGEKMFDATGRLVK